MPSRCHAGPPGKYRIFLQKFPEDKQNRISRKSCARKCLLGNKENFYCSCRRLGIQPIGTKNRSGKSLTMPHYGRPARLKRTSLRVCACDAAIAYAPVHPRLFILIWDNPEFLDSCRPLSAMKRITARKNAMPVQRYAPVEPYRN